LTVSHRKIIIAYQCCSMNHTHTAKMIAANRQLGILMRQNVRLARRWRVDQLDSFAIERLRSLTKTFRFSLALGDFQYLDGGWYVTHAGLLRLAQRRRCVGIHVRQVPQFCDLAMSRWVFKATVFCKAGSKGFAGYGDADPSNVSSLVHGAEMRVAETRAVNRALRKAYGIGLCSVEELGWSPKPQRAGQATQDVPPAAGNNGHHNGQPRLRDRLCLLIRQHRLDANLVKAYAADYCGTPTLRDASRESVEAFINQLAERAVKDREGLLCHLNSYSKLEEVTE
jgi:hypothetical protein